MGQSNAGKRLCPACQVTTLSRYNPDPLCGPCTRETTAPAGTERMALAARGWLWDSAPVRAALARADLGAFVAEVRTRWGLSQTELAGMVDWLSQAAVSQIESGQRGTLYDLRRLLSFTDAIGMPRAALAPLLLGDPDATLEGGTSAAVQGVDSVDIGRRGFNFLAGGLVVGTVLPTPNRAELTHVRYLRTTLTELRAQSDAVGGGAVLPKVLHNLEYARRILDESDYTTTVGRELLLVTADMGIQAGWFAYDADNQPLSRRLYEQAALLADSADDGAQRAYLYANMVQQSTCLARYTGRTGFAREALRFAGRATEAARHEPSPRLHALISLRSALAHAQLGDEAAFRSAISAARRELDRGPHPSDTYRTRFVRPSEVSVYEALGRATLGAPQRAVRVYDTVLADDARSPRDQAYFRSLLAETLITAREPDQAIAHGMAILPASAPTLTSGRILRALAPVREAAATTGADEFCARFDTTTRALRSA